MKINNLSFPYPVLGIGDDILPKPSFASTPIIAESEDYSTYIIEINVDMRNADIYRLIKSGRAIYVCEVGCTHTKYRKCFKSDVGRLNFEIPKYDIGGEVDFEVSIVCIDYIKSYCNSNSHEDYKGFSIDLEPGDLLAYIGKFTNDFEINYAQIRSMGSFMQISENKFSQDTYFYFEGDKIDIKLPTELYENYRSRIKGDLVLQDIIHSSIVFNALVSALMSFHDGENNLKLWERTIKYRIETEPELMKYKEVLETKDINDILELAQTLLMNPYDRMFKGLSRLTQINDEEEE